MPKWLSSSLIVIGFLALVALAILPKNITVIVDVDSDTAIHNETTVNHNGPVAGAPAPATDHESDSNN